MAVTMDIEVPRNGDFLRTSQLVDDAGAPIDLTGNTLEMEIRRLPGDGGSAVATGTITIWPGIDGYFDELIRGADLGAISGTYAVVRFAYDLRRTHPDGILTVERRGHINYVPGTTYG